MKPVEYEFWHALMVSSLDHAHRWQLIQKREKQKNQILNPSACIRVLIHCLHRTLSSSNSNGGKQDRWCFSLVGFLQSPSHWTREFLCLRRPPSEFGIISIFPSLFDCYCVFEFTLNYFGAYLGEQVEAQPFLVPGFRFTFQATKWEIKGSFEFAETPNWHSPTHYTTSNQR